MEYYTQGAGNPFEQTNSQDLQNPFYRYQKCSHIPVQNKLKQNKQRRQMIQREKQKQKQYILQKRRQKQDNVQKILKQRQQAKQNAKMIFANMQKTFTHQFEDKGLKRTQDIEQKIQQCRTRADKYRTMYKKKIHDERQDKERSVRERKNMKEKLANDRSINFHLAQWKSYEKRIVEKYKNQHKNPTRMYENMVKKQQQLKKIIQTQKKQQQQRFSVPSQTKPSAFRTIILKKTTSAKQPHQPDDPDNPNPDPHHPDPHSQPPQKNSPIFSTLPLSALGLGKSIKNPGKLLQSMKMFIEENSMLEDPLTDQSLVEKFGNFLGGLVEGKGN